MADKLGENIDSLVTGKLSESVSESDEVFAQRLAAAQARLAQIQKQEGKAKIYDQKLVVIIKTLPVQYLEIVIFFLNHDFPSLTIIAFLSLVNEPCDKIAHQRFHEHIAEAADFSESKFLRKDIEKIVSLWWTYIFGADYVSKTVRFKDLSRHKEFKSHFTFFYLTLLRDFFATKNYKDFEELALKKNMEHFRDRLFRGE